METRSIRYIASQFRSIQPTSLCRLLMESFLPRLLSRLILVWHCEDLPLPLAHVGDKKVKRFHFSEIIGRLPYVRATVTGTYKPRKGGPSLDLSTSHILDESPNQLSYEKTHALRLVA
jgi:hypothetical protein